MSDAVIIDGPRAEPTSGSPPDSLIVLLHGLGADGNDLFSLTSLLSEHFPKAVFVAPNAPYPCDMSPFGYQWFSLQDRSFAAMSAGVKSVAPVLDAFLDTELRRYGINENRLVLLGFSQGTMMALHVALRRTRPCACILGFSGALVIEGDISNEIVSRMPIFLSHGDSDDVVPIEALEKAARTLGAAGLAVQTNKEVGLGHSIGQQGLNLGLNFMLQHLRSSD